MPAQLAAIRKQLDVPTRASMGEYGAGGSRSLTLVDVVWLCATTRVQSPSPSRLMAP